MKFSKKSGRTIENFINKKPYKLMPLTYLEPAEGQLERVASICNESLVFETLFSKIFPEGEHPLSSAADWIQWGKAGWVEGSHFVFATLRLI